MEARPVMDLLAEVMKISEMKLDDDAMKDLKQDMRVNPMRQALQEVLCEEREKNAALFRPQSDCNQKENDQTERLDNMLKAEGIIGNTGFSLPPDTSGNDQEEYRQKLMLVRQTFEEQIKDCTVRRHEFAESVRLVLQVQAEFRPITRETVDNIADIVSNKFNRIPQLLKQSACEAVIHLRKRFFDARRKRRNFPKNSTEILNEYFLANLNHPYPSEEVKQALAMQCNMSVVQVSNWFGNKRIRYKKAMAKNKEEHREITRAPKNVLAPSPYGMMNNPLGGIVNPYQMMMPGQQFGVPIGMQPFHFPVYNADIMSQYQQMSQPPNQEA